MKRIIIAVLTALSCQLSSAQLGTWKAYMAYHDIQQIQAVGDDIFVMASNNLYLYNQADHSISTLDCIHQLTDVNISQIKWCPAAKRLVVCYANSNIDLVETNLNVRNVADLYNKSMTNEKTINHIYISGKYAYLSTAFGVVKLNVADAEISDSYQLGINTKKTAISGNRIYANTNNGVMTALLSDNLVDKNNWSYTSQYDATIFTDDNSDYEKYHETIETLSPGGPKYNNFYEMKFKNNTLYATGGIYSQLVDTGSPGSIQCLSNDEWTIFQDQLDTITGFKYIDINCVDVDPLDPKHVFAGGRTGLYEFYDGKYKNHYNSSNSILNTALNDNFIMIHGIAFNSQGELWILNSRAVDDVIFKIDRNGELKGYGRNPLLVNSAKNIAYKFFRNVYVSKDQQMVWFVNDNWEYPAVYSYRPSDNTLICYNSFSNQDGKSYYPTGVLSLTEDKDGNIWFTTDQGPFYLAKEDIGKSEVQFVQVKVPRNDGTNYADYLMTGVPTSCIAIDGAGRKWFGTNGSGVYLISEDNMTQIEHFTKENSPIISNNITSIAINDDSGEVFFATDAGLCSYKSDVVTPAESMDKNSVYAYPNPVTPDYNGQISVVGLTMNADVKITTATGYLVAEGRSNGGMFTWDGCDRSGNRVASGVYNVITATSDGKKGTVCKIAVVK